MTMSYQTAPFNRLSCARNASACGFVLLGVLWCGAGAAHGDEMGLRQSVQSLIAATGLPLSSEPMLAAAPRTQAPAAPAAPAYKPAPLEINSVLVDTLQDGGEEEAADAALPEGVEVVRERYPNRRVKIERHVTLDDQGNYVNHGSWKMWDEAGNLVAEGQYDMGNRTGRWTRTLARNSSPLFNTVPFAQAQGPYMSQATYENGLLHGDWTIYDANQKPLSRIAFSQGHRHGPAILWHHGGQVIRQMTYSHGNLDGEVIELGDDGKLGKTAVYEDGRRVAQKVTNFPGTRNHETEAMYLFAKLVPKTPDNFWAARFAEYERTGEDQRHGPWRAWYENGQIKMQGEYQYDLPVGQFSWWHPNGQKYAEGQYVDGREHGVWRWWHENGQKWSQGEFRNGEQVCQWSRWSEDGLLEKQATHSGPPRTERTVVVETATSGNLQ